MAGDVEDALSDFPDPLAHYNQTNAEARLFELLVAVLREDCSDLRLGVGEPPLYLFSSCVASDELALCDDMTFHRGIHLAPLCTRA